MTFDMTYDDLKRNLTARFRAAELGSADLDARLLIESVTGYSAAELILNGQNIVPPAALGEIEALAARRLAREPVDHILGYREFYGRRFEISKDVLSPRPETEGLVDAALATIKNTENPHILDLGTGSGAIIISVLAERSDAAGVAADVSHGALDIAARNAAAHNVATGLTLTESDWFSAVDGVFDLIVSNPPYITDAAMEALSFEVTGFDPDLALRGGPDGLAPYRIITARAADYLKPGAALIFEIGYDQGAAVSSLMKRCEMNWKASKNSSSS